MIVDQVMGWLYLTTTALRLRREVRSEPGDDELFALTRHALPCSAPGNCAPLLPATG